MEKTLTWVPEQGGILDPTFETAVLALRVEYGRTATSGGDGFPAHVASPRAITLTATESGEWTLSEECEDALSVPIPQEGGYEGEPVLWQSCPVRIRRAGIDALLWLELFGDGEVRASMGSGELTVE